MNNTNRKLSMRAAALVFLVSGLCGCRKTAGHEEPSLSSVVSITANVQSIMEKSLSSQSMSSENIGKWNESKDSKESAQQFPRESIKANDLMLYDQKRNRQYKLGSSKSEFDPSEFGESWMTLAEGAVSYDGVDIGFKDQKVRGFSLFEEKTDPQRFQMKNHITIGTNMSEVLKTYGTPTTGTASSIFNYVYFDENNQLTIMDPEVKNPPKKYEDISRYYYLNIMFDGHNIDSKITAILVGDYDFMNPM